MGAGFMKIRYHGSAIFCAMVHSWRFQRTHPHGAPPSRISSPMVQIFLGISVQCELSYPPLWCIFFHSGTLNTWASTMGAGSMKIRYHGSAIYCAMVHFWRFQRTRCHGTSLTHIHGAISGNRRPLLKPERVPQMQKPPKLSGFS